MNESHASAHAAQPAINPGDWVPVRRIRVGAICAVDEVVLCASGRRLVLKHMHKEHVPDPGIAARCLNEALILRLLSQEGGTRGVPRPLAMGLLPDGCPYLLLEPLGSSLEELRVSPAWPDPGSTTCIATTLTLAAQILQTLARVHARGIVHRDVRPDNILLGELRREEPTRLLGEPHLIDFGLAKVSGSDELLPVSTGDEDFLGTDEYMAPEQWESAKSVTGAADVYALGVVLYLLVSGRLPFSSPRRQVLMYRHLMTPPDPLPHGVPRELSCLILSMLAKRPADRPTAYESAQQLLPLL